MSTGHPGQKYRTKKPKIKLTAESISYIRKPEFRLVSGVMEGAIFSQSSRIKDGKLDQEKCTIETRWNPPKTQFEQSQCS